MSRTESAMVALGTIAPSFELVDAISGRALSRDDIFAMSAEDEASAAVNTATQRGLGGPRDLRGPRRKHGLLVMFVCVHCPYVKHVEGELGRLGREYFGADGEGPIAIAAIQSNDTIEYPGDGPDGMREQASRCGWSFPYLLDEAQETARSYGAECTPDFFLFNAEMELVYRGQLDSSRPRRGNFGNDQQVTGEDLRRALDAVILRKRPDPNQRGSIGCNIKWRQS